MIPQGMEIILSEVNFNPDKIKIVQCVAGHNESEWIEYPIKSTYDEVDRIIVVEGAVKGRPNSTPDGHSTDNTLDIIKNLDDPQNKIELITKDGFWNDLEEQKQTFLDNILKIQNAHPDWQIWVYICDADEVMFPEDIKRFRKAIEKRPYATEFIPTFLHFWRDFHHVRAPSEDWNILHQRFFKYQSGMQFKTHPIATDAEGVDTCLSPQYQQFRFQIPNLYVYHYGCVKSIDFQREKAKFYKSELAKYGAAQEAQDKLKTFENYNEDPITVLRFSGQHPKVMTNHPLYNKTDSTLKEWDDQDKTVGWSENKFYSGIPLPTVFTWHYRRPESLWPINPLEV